MMQREEADHSRRGAVIHHGQLSHVADMDGRRASEPVLRDPDHRWGQIDSDKGALCIELLVIHGKHVPRTTGRIDQNPR